MADVKISGLPASSLPLAGTEVLPIVQSGITKKVATDDLTVKNVRSNATSGVLQVVGPAAAATRVMTTPDANFTVARTDAGQTFTGVNTFTSPKIITDISDTNGNELLKVTATASAVNEITVANAATGNNPVLSATGSDTNIGITLTPKGTGDAVLTSGNLVIGTSGKGISYPVPAGGTALAPAFSAYGDAIQSLSNNTATKVAYNVSVFDTNSNYSAANARFTPTVAGYYQVNCLASTSIVLTSSLQLAIYKNGAVYQNLYTDYNGGGAIANHTDFTMTGSSLVYLNGSTDYIEIYATASNGGGSTAINGYSARPDVNYFNAVMVRAT
jgi:hypothetical protein